MNVCIEDRNATKQIKSRKNQIKWNQINAICYFSCFVQLELHFQRVNHIFMFVFVRVCFVKSWKPFMYYFVRYLRKCYKLFNLTVIVLDVSRGHAKRTTHTQEGTHIRQHLCSNSHICLIFYMYLTSRNVSARGDSPVFVTTTLSEIRSTRAISQARSING